MCRRQNSTETYIFLQCRAYSECEVFNTGVAGYELGSRTGSGLAVYVASMLARFDYGHSFYKVLTPRAYQDYMAIATFPKSRLLYTLDASNKYGDGYVQNRPVVGSQYFFNYTRVCSGLHASHVPPDEMRPI